MELQYIEHVDRLSTLSALSALSALSLEVECTNLNSEYEKYMKYEGLNSSTLQHANLLRKRLGRSVVDFLEPWSP